MRHFCERKQADRFTKTGVRYSAIVMNFEYFAVGGLGGYESVWIGVEREGVLARLVS